MDANIEEWPGLHGAVITWRGGAVYEQTNVEENTVCLTCNLTWRDLRRRRRSCTEYRCRSGIEALMQAVQLRWCGHIVRMDDSRIPKFYGQLCHGLYHPSRQYKQYKDCLKATLSQCDISITILLWKRGKWQNSLAWRLSLIHIWRCRRSTLCRSRWSPYH